MIMLSKPQPPFFRRHLKSLLIIGLLCGLVTGSVLAIASMEGAFLDPAGQLNNPVTLECNSGVLANRDVPISDDGEYNWMLIKGQQMMINISIGGTNHTLNVFFHSFSSEIGAERAVLNVETTSVDWSFRIVESGHWRLEMVNGDQVGRQYFVSVFVNAKPVSHFLGLVDCLNPGDLFRTD